MAEPSCNCLKLYSLQLPILLVLIGHTSFVMARLSRMETLKVKGLKCQTPAEPLSCSRLFPVIANCQLIRMALNRPTELFRRHSRLILTRSVIGPKQSYTFIYSHILSNPTKTSYRMTPNTGPHSTISFFPPKHSSACREQPHLGATVEVTQ